MGQSMNVTAAGNDLILERGEAYFRKIFEHSHEAILVIDPGRDQIVDTNPRACSLLGYRRDEVLALPFSALCPDALPALLYLVQTVIDQDAGWTDELSCRTRSGTPLPVEISVSTLDSGDRCYLLATLHPASECHAMEQALRSIVEGTATATGTEFFYSLVRALAGALKVRYAFVAELLDDKSRVRTLAYWYDGQFIDNFEFDTVGTPCELVARGETVYYTSKVYERFPHQPELARLGIESYFGVPLLSETGDDQLGHLTVFHDQPMVKEFRGMAILKIFAARARTELERKRAEQALHRSEERLAGILASATDAIITIDGQQRITLFNAAAEKMFRCKAEQFIGRSFEQILSQPFSQLLKNTFLAALPSAATRQQLWAPEGLTARRLDGEEFPVDATVSLVEIGEQRLYTLIMRDLTERRQAEETLNRLQREVCYLQEAVKSAQNIGAVVGEAPAMQAVFHSVQQVAGTDSTVLLTGETGTGKGMIARTIHELSPRKDQLLVTVNCAALPGELVESELFGHEKGAFTGATAQRKGRFELANGGTIFLDEVGELSASTQAKLLRVLQDQEFERVGGTRSLKVNVRVIAATNCNLADRVKTGHFRSDLFYRLNVFPLQLPALRERPSDIPLLARHFLDHFAKKMGKPIRDFSPKALEQLTHYFWPGNVRELQNVIERAVILAQGPLLEVDKSLALHLEDPNAPPSFTAGTLEEIERRYILKVLEECRWVIEGEAGAATILGLKPSTLRSRMQKLGIHKPAAS
jgi:PAS domain S-box-containing protein